MKVLNFRAHARAECGVEVGKWFIKQEHSRLLNKGPP